MSNKRSSGSPTFGPEFAKSVAFTSLAISRAMVVPESGDDEPSSTWAIDGYRLPDDVTLLVFGDFLVKGDGWTVGATSALALRIRKNTRLAKAEPEELREIFPKLAQWLEHLLYDLAAAKARELLASVYPPPSIDVESVTPEADQVRFFDYREGGFGDDSLDEQAAV